MTVKIPMHLQFLVRFCIHFRSFFIIQCLYFKSTRLSNILKAMKRHLLSKCASYVENLVPLMLFAEHTF